MTSLLNPFRRRKGYLALIGGAEDRSGHMEVLRQTLALNGAQTVSIIPAASEYPRDLASTYQRAFGDLGAPTVHFVDIRHLDEADRPEHHEMIETSDLVFFTGGDQVKLAAVLRGTQLLDRIRCRHLLGATIAGTSAGAAVASDPMIFDGDEEGLTKGSVRWEAGFGWLNGVTVDTHFMERNRLPRLIQFLCTGQSHCGLGLSENTGLLIGPDGVGQVVGTGVVVSVDSRCMLQTNFPMLPAGSRYGVDGIRIGFHPQGTHFDLKKWAALPYWPETPTCSSLPEACHERL